MDKGSYSDAMADLDMGGEDEPVSANTEPEAKPDADAVMAELEAAVSKLRSLMAPTRSAPPMEPSGGGMGV